MERFIDKALLFAACAIPLLFVPFTVAYAPAFFGAVIVSCANNPRVCRFGWAFLAAYGLACCALPALLLFWPALFYDAFRVRHPYGMLLGIAVPLACWTRMDLALLAVVLGLCIGAGVLSWRAQQAERERSNLLAMRDSLRESSYALEQQNRRMRDMQDMDVRVATLAERNRISREIHDNVGHLLTRALLQVEAMKVVHACDEGLCQEYARIGDTLHEAMGTMRESVHGLHDESFDLQGRLQELLDGTSFDTAEFAFDAATLPSALSYCIVAVTSEALSNAARHGDATRVRVSVLEFPAFVQLIVQDNGTKPPTSLTGGMGMQTMEERVRALDGVFHASYDKGFKVFASLPKPGNDEQGGMQGRQETTAGKAHD